MEKQNIIGRYNKLIKIGPKSDISKQARGLEFEKLVCQLFEIEKLLLRYPYHTDDNRAEQIDGAIKINNRIILLEVKWVESGLAASDLYAFIGKIENKLQGTIGLFISKETLSDNFLNAIVKGRRRNTIVIHGDDIQHIFLHNFSLKNYINFLIEIYSCDNVLHYPANKFLRHKKLLKVENIITTASTEMLKKEKIKKFFLIVNRKKELDESTVDVEIEDFTKPEKIYILKYLIRKYSEYRIASEGIFTGSLYNRATNSSTAIKCILSDKYYVESTADEYFRLLIEIKSIYYLIPLFWNKYQSIYKNNSQKNEINKSIINIFENIMGDWESENIVTNVIEEIWEQLNYNQKERAYCKYIEIYLDRNRKSKFDQKRFAYKLIESEFESNKNNFIKSYLNKKIEKDINDFSIVEEDINNEVFSYLHKYDRLLNEIEITEKENYLTTLFKESLT